MSIKETIRSFSDERWNVGFIANDVDSIMRGDPISVDWVKHRTPRSWFADPFILDVTPSEIVLLVEEFYKPIKRGRISRLTIDRQSLELKRIDVVLELDTHLSFPAIARVGGEVYIYPENGESGHLTLYKYHPESNKVEKVCVLCDDAVEDAVITEAFGGVYMFATPRTAPNGNRLDIYRYDEQQCKMVPDSHVTFKENVARMAGQFFEYGGHIYRPTQECNVQYGHAVTLQEFNRTADRQWSYREVRRWTSTNKRLTIGTHTINTYKGLIVTDALGFDRMWFRKILKTLKILP